MISYFILLANLSDDALEPLSSVTSTGIYFGYARVLKNDDGSQLNSDDLKVWPMVMSLGWNPFYKNEKMTAVCIIFSFLILLLTDRPDNLTGSTYNA